MIKTLFSSLFSNENTTFCLVKGFGYKRWRINAFQKDLSRTFYSWSVFSDWTFDLYKALHRRGLHFWFSLLFCSIQISDQSFMKNLLVQILIGLYLLCSLWFYYSIYFGSFQLTFYQKFTNIFCLFGRSFNDLSKRYLQACGFMI